MILKHRENLIPSLCGHLFKPQWWEGITNKVHYINKSLFDVDGAVLGGVFQLKWAQIFLHGFKWVSGQNEL